MSQFSTVKEQLLEMLGQLTVLQACDLVKTLEQEWGVSATPAPPVVLKPPIEVPPKATLAVTLKGHGMNNTVQAVKALRPLLNLSSMGETKKLLDELPHKLFEGPREEAEKLAQSLEQAGFFVEVE